MHRMLARFQVLPGGIIVGCVVPKEYTGAHAELQEGTVYEVNGTDDMTWTIGPIGKADFTMPATPFSMDQFLVKAHGNHLTVGGGK